MPPSLPPSRASTSSSASSNLSIPNQPIARARPLQPPRNNTRRERFLTDLKSPMDPTTYTIPTEHRNDTTTTVREYLRSKQRAKICSTSVLRFLLTVVLCTICAGVLCAFERKENLNTGYTQLFNALLTVIPLLIAFNFSISLQSYMKILRWWVLAQWYWPLPQFDGIMDAASLGGIPRLIKCSRRQRWVCVPTMVNLSCVLWLLVHVIGAVSVALLSLAYNTGESNGIVTRGGNVSVLNLTSNSVLDNAGMSNNSVFDNAWYYGTYSSRPSKESVSAKATCELYDGVTSSLGYKAYMTWESRQ
ncbi:hypothetical protein P153DRAFT_368864 [Dothidotthia symphoricarpi CBS 119687]|uniref:Uncharacterized protein n=1 Tax=Dothidotthia symphoricarpi CBS 119687 TaxID=1392245 RepID=A0A6A6A839_9PLEO|nr:uncharacterized protein P153DRAFT_368864 [Dothidotthia symphoricarpi CBS 119687]KAF2126821.1 hypothetical protein P153DRAFT_368864 [Dothidotthia symphoricarpi CBS 119687]